MVYGVCAQAIVVLVRALCAVSTEELRDVRAPRVFMLTKVVEVALYNMTRIRCGRTHMLAH